MPMVMTDFQDTSVDRCRMSNLVSLYTSCQPYTRLLYSTAACSIIATSIELMIYDYYE
jgi:hypothetical protein